MSLTPAQIIEQGRMHPMQWVAVALTIALNALDGFDILSSAFAGPGIKAQWNLGPEGLGLVLSMELIGMGFGSILLGGMADKLGRRPTMLACLVLMAAGMFLAHQAATPQSLSAWRFMTGIGIGGMLAAINAVAAELSNLKNRSFAMALMVIGYPLGAFIGGLIAQVLLKGNDWRIVFEFGAIMTAICIPLVWLFIPETPAFLAVKQPKGALAAVNKTLTRYGHDPVDALPPLPPAAEKPSVMDILKPNLIGTTMILSIGYAFHAITFYYILKMVPTIMSDPDFAGQHFTRPQGAGVLAWANLGGAMGGAAFGWFMHRFGIRISTSVALVGGSILIMIFGLGQSSLMGWTLMVVACGLFTNSAIVGYYSAFAKGFPTHVRATGTGFALGVGRAGAAFSPILAGYLFSQHIGLFAVSAVMAVGSIVSAFILSRLRLDA